MNAFSADVNSRQVVQPLAMIYSTWFEISVSESGGRNENVSNTLQVAVFWAPTLTLRMCNEKSTRCLPENADKCSLHVHAFFTRAPPPISAATAASAYPHVLRSSKPIHGAVGLDGATARSRGRCVSREQRATKHSDWQAKGSGPHNSRMQHVYYAL